MASSVQLVSFRLAEETFALPIRSVQEILRVPAISAVPNAPGHMRGVINLRGRIVWVMDLRARLGMTQAEHTGRTRVMIVESQKRIVGLIVDRASEVLRIADDRIQPAPELLFSADRGCVSGIAKLDGQLVIVLEPESLLAARHEAQSAELTTARAV
jgi:purine-binding chemotaxis protein CheW